MSVDTSLKAAGEADLTHLTGFQHEIFAHEDASSFIAGMTPYILEGVERDEAVVVVASAEKIGLLREGLGDSAKSVVFEDMGAVGLNPGRIIPAWQRYLDEARLSGRNLRGVSEPIWFGRDEAELDECHRHEALLNTVFADSGPWSLLCPYDTGRLGHDILREAETHHPVFVAGGVRHPSPGFFADFDVFGGALPEPPVLAAALTFDAATLARIRETASAVASGAGLPATRVADFTLAMHELAANSLAHGGGSGIARFWRDDVAVVGEVRDAGMIDEPLVGRIKPKVAAERGRGLFLVHQLCDLVQVRSSATGSVVRARMGIPQPASAACRRVRSAGSSALAVV